MKRISSMLIGTSLILITSIGTAATPTQLDANWICKTNASSGSTDTEKNADKQMSESVKSAAEAFTFASQNCRDCTQITCEVKNP